MVKIRFARGGRIHRPVYTLVATDERSARDGKFLQKLGQYNPLAKKAEEQLLNINVEAIATWMKNGAQMSTTTKSLLKKHKIHISY